ncbi:hypothetical protein L218DRAFT_1071482 [Marasmius fiardii PR-910]|nr:hypothetical protein L218DRAFT_1071482 [Marasmius fiardii PR-910]
MSAYSPRHDSSPRAWWSLPKSTSNPSFHPDKSSPRDPTLNKSDSLKFSTIASAIGFTKSRKHPSLTIQNPPAILTARTHPSPLFSPQSPPFHPSRPPSKSVSSTKSRVDSLEPRTPSDSRDSGSHRHSLLTLSDIDPFAARNISLASPSDPNRLSAYSASSIPDYHIHPNKSDPQPPIDRRSYASSSSRSHSNHIEDTSLPNGRSWVSELPNYRPAKRKETGDFGSSDENLTLEDPVWDQLFDPAMDNLIKSSSSTTLTDYNRLSHPDPAHLNSRMTRPPMRVRGMTVGTVAQRSKFLQDEKESKPSPKVNVPPTSFNHRDPISPASPRVIVRQPSIQRMGLPSTAPPNQKLPPPPPVSSDLPEDQRPGSQRAETDSVSSVFSSLSRNTGMHNQHYIPRSKIRERNSVPFQPSEERADSSTAPLSLKKAVSQQSLKGTITSSKTEDKVLKKQRSFHHTRHPVPPIPAPLRLKDSLTNSDGFQVVDSKRDSTSRPSTPARKRLFSGSSTRRASTYIAPEEETRSNFSIPLETDYVPRPSRKSSQAGLVQQPLQASSFWDEADPPCSPHPSVLDYTPMQIMSPAEMLKLEASVQESMELPRSRGFSIASASSTFSSDSEYTPSIMGITSQVLGPSTGNNPPGPLRSHSLLAPRDKDSAPTMAARPSTSQGTPMVQSTSYNDTPSEFVSLPPPPRPRRKTQPLVDSSCGPPVLESLPPPPRVRSKSLRSNTSNKLTTPPVTSTTTTRKSIMRKPSFLHIDDDFSSVIDVADHHQIAQAPEPLTRNIFKHEDSFLDFARDSMDTLRSDE